MDAYYIEWIKWTKITMATFTFSPFYMSSFSTLPFSSAFSFLDTFAYTIKILQWELHFNLISCFAFHRRCFLFSNLHVLTEIPFACFGELIATAPDDRVLRAFVSRCCWFPDRKWHLRVKLYQSRGKSTFYQSNRLFCWHVLIEDQPMLNEILHVNVVLHLSKQATFIFFDQFSWHYDY